MSANRQLSPFDRATAGLLFLSMVLGGFGLWIGVPAVILWALAELVDEPAQHLVLALIAVPTGMALFAVLLSRLNRAYLRVNGFDVVGTEEEEWVPQLKGPLDRILVICAVVALIALIALIALMAFGDSPLSSGVP